MQPWVINMVTMIITITITITIIIIIIIIITIMQCCGPQHSHRMAANATNTTNNTDDDDDDEDDDDKDNENTIAFISARSVIGGKEGTGHRCQGYLYRVPKRPNLRSAPLHFTPTVGSGAHAHHTRWADRGPQLGPGLLDRVPRALQQNAQGFQAGISQCHGS